MAEQQAAIASQQGIIVELQRRVEELEARLSGGGRSRGMPGNKPGPGRRAGVDDRPRKRSSRGFGRWRMEPADRVEHAVDVCPYCGTGLSGGWTHRTREVIARNCPVCRRRRLPKLELGGVVVVRERLGNNLVSLVVTLRERARLPIRSSPSSNQHKAVRFSWTVHLDVTEGRVCGSASGEIDFRSDAAVWARPLPAEPPAHAYAHSRVSARPHLPDAVWQIRFAVHRESRGPARGLSPAVVCLRPADVGQERTSPRLLRGRCAWTRVVSPPAQSPRATPVIATDIDSTLEVPVA